MSGDGVLREGSSQSSRSPTRSPSKRRSSNSPASKSKSPSASRGEQGGSKPRSSSPKRSLPRIEEDGRLVAKLRGLPFSVRVSELVDFFLPLKVAESDIFITTGPNGKSTGDGFIRFDREDRDAVYKKNGVYLGSRYVEIKEARSEDLERAKEVAKGTWMRLRGLPFNSTLRDVVEFLGDEWGVPEERIKLPAGRPTGECYIEYGDEDKASGACKALDRKEIGGRYIETFLSSYEDYDRSGFGRKMGNKNRDWEIEREERELRRGGGPAGPRGEGWIRMRGLPFDAKDDDILFFLGNIGVTDIVAPRDPTGRPTGSAFVKLSDLEGVHAALARDHGFMGTRYIDIFRADEQEIVKALREERARR